jgi:signal transduction histidine kinase
MGIRGYVTTGDTGFLETYHNAQEVLRPRLDSLRALTADNKDQQSRIDSLRSLAMARVDMCRKYIALAGGKKLDDENLAVFTLESKANMTNIRAAVGGIVKREQALLKTRKSANQQSRDDFNLSVALIYTEIVLLLIITFISFLFYLYRRKKYEQNILQLNADLAQNVAELNNANKELESFSYSVSHDLRAPLRIIDGFSKVLAEDYKDKLDSEGVRFINTIRNNAQHMGQLIDDLLNFSRISRQELAIHEIDMGKVVEQVIASFRQLSPPPAADIQIINLTNEHLIRQVWTNLISNAVKYSRKKENPVIRISTQETDTEIVYSIEDNGVGFDMEFADKLFGVFQRLHKVTEYEGTGVGLALVSRIVTRHHGRVWAESVEGAGATFYFSLPK